MSEGELLIGGGTLALAGATVWLALEARTSRTQAGAATQRRLLRSALAELLDDLRIWTGANPAQGAPALERIRLGQPRLAALQRLVDEADLPPDLAVYLVWLTGRIRDEWLWWPTVIAVVANPNESPADNPVNSGVGKWAMMVDRLQVAAALVAGEASRRKFSEIRRVHGAAPWTTVLPGPPRERELRSLADRAMLGAPAFPVGDDYAHALPVARDHAGATTAARQKDALSGLTP